MEVTKQFKMAEQQISESKNSEGFKIFDIYDVSDVLVKDSALKSYINIYPKILLKSQGRNTEKFSATKVNIVERLANRLAVPGHIGKKHKIITNWSSGKYNKNMGNTLRALGMIQEKTKKNPIQVLVNAVENASPRDEITVIEHGGARYPQAVDVSPLRRVNLAIRWIVQGAYSKSFGKKRSIAEALANEIIQASDGNMESYAMKKKNEAEKQADSAR